MNSLMGIQPTPNKPLPELDPLKFDIPKLTFGLELEFHFAVKKQIFENWLKTANTDTANKARKTPPPDPVLAPNTSPFEVTSQFPPDGNSFDPDTQSWEMEWHHQDFRRNDAHPADIELPDESGYEEEESEVESDLEPEAEAIAPDVNNGGGEDNGAEEDGEANDGEDQDASSQDPDLQSRLLLYVVDLLSRKLPTSQKGPNLLGDINFDEPKKADSAAWHLTDDGSVLPHRSMLPVEWGFGKDDAEGDQAPERKRKDYWVVGAELVSCVLDYENENEWFPMLQQIDNDLKWNGDYGAWFDDEPNVHVHFGFKDEEVELPVVKNLIALYGLCEREIERWFKVYQRGESPYCRSLRDGMQKPRDDIYIDNDILKRMKKPKVPGRYYTPHEFAKRVYACKSLEELKGEVSGFPTAPYSDDSLRPSLPLETRNGPFGWVTVNISLKRDNKPTTVEFRQHDGTVDPVRIRWWVKFCGDLLRYSYTAALSKEKFKDYGKFRALNYISRVDNFHKEKSILDRIGFYEDGKAYFKSMAEAFKNERHDKKRKAEELVIEERMVLRRRGWRSGPMMEGHISRWRPYLDKCKELGLKTNWQAQEFLKRASTHNIALQRERRGQVRREEQRRRRDERRRMRDGRR